MTNLSNNINNNYYNKNYIKININNILFDNNKHILF